MKIFKNIKFRLLTGLFIFLFTIFYCLGYILIDSFKQTYHQTIQDSLSTLTKDLKHDFNIYLNDSSEFENIKHEFDIDILYGQIITINTKNNPRNTFIINAKSDDLRSYNLAFYRYLIPQISSENIIYSIQHIEELTPKKIQVATVMLEQTSNTITVLQCAIPFSKETRFIENMKIYLWLSFLALLFIVLIAVYFIISKSLEATKLVVDEVKNIRLDGNIYHVKTTGISREIDDLIKTFNVLIDDLQANYNKVKDFGQNASHELKTPLTIIRGEIEVGLRKERTISEYKDILLSTINELNFLQDTIEKILFLSSNPNIDIIKTFEEVYVDEILTESINEKQAFAKTKNIKINLIELSPLTTKGNQSLLKIAINNLIDNAIKYSNKESFINISLTNNKLIIEDFGCGIPKNDLEKVFDRFYRVDKIRSTRNGSGLGLSIVKTIFELHGFKISIKSLEGEFTKTIVQF